MIVCICHGVTERHLETVVAGGARTLGEVERACGAGGDCGSCRGDVERVIERIGLCPRSRVPTATRMPAVTGDAQEL